MSKQRLQCFCWLAAQLYVNMVQQFRHTSGQPVACCWYAHLHPTFTMNGSSGGVAPRLNKRHLCTFSCCGDKGHIVRALQSACLFGSPSSQLVAGIEAYSQYLCSARLRGLCKRKISHFLGKEFPLRQGYRKLKTVATHVFPNGTLDPGPGGLSECPGLRGRGSSTSRGAAAGCCPPGKVDRCGCSLKRPVNTKEIPFWLCTTHF